ncbi:MAG: transcriptional regulator [Caulobacteraceae bacterium]
MDGFDIGKIDDVIHGRMRLGIMAWLANAEVADFNELKGVLQATQGNLSVHLRKLEDAGYIAIEKSFLDRKPLTRARITPEGRKAFTTYLAAMAKLVEGQG